MPVRRATSFENELSLAARLGHSIVIVSASPEVLGETGHPLAANGKELNVLFSHEQAQRMAVRLLAD